MKLIMLTEEQTANLKRMRKQLRDLGEHESKTRAQLCVTHNELRDFYKSFTEDGRAVLFSDDCKYAFAHEKGDYQEL